MELAVWKELAGSDSLLDEVVMEIDMHILIDLPEIFFSTLFLSVSMFLYAYQHREPLLYFVASDLIVVCVGLLLEIFEVKPVHPFMSWMWDLAVPLIFIAVLFQNLFFLNGLVNKPLTEFLIKWNSRLPFHFPFLSRSSVS